VELSTKNYFRGLFMYDEKTRVHYFKDPEVEKADKRAVISL
jgi:hypothetical protein